MAKTKIVATLGPSCDGPGVLTRMVRAGTDVARVNFSHGDHPTHAARIRTVREAARKEGRTLAILGDLQGPKLRVGEIAGGSAELQQDSLVRLTTREVPGDSREIPLPHPELVAEVEVGQRLLLDDGQIELIVDSKTETDLLCRVEVGGILASNKGINLPGAALSMSSLTDKDYADVAFALEQGVEYLALSFVRRAADVELLRSFLCGRGEHVRIIAKIEKAEAVANFDEILAAADAIMVARGDLGVETPAEQVPILQKRILMACNRAGKPSITATQMLQSMMEKPRPTRAEASDVANAVLDGSDAVMLSGETAAGRYPVEAVEMMERVISIAETQMDTMDWLRRAGMPGTPSDAIARATVEIASELKAAAIITSTITGHTSCLVARYRPCVPILAATPDPTTCRHMALVWGVVPRLVPEYATTDEMVDTTTRAAVEAGLVRSGDLVVITSGMPVQGARVTNMLKVHVI